MKSQSTFFGERYTENERNEAWEAHVSGILVEHNAFVNYREAIIEEQIYSPEDALKYDFLELTSENYPASKDELRVRDLVTKLEDGDKLPNGSLKTISKDTGINYNFVQRFASAYQHGFPSASSMNAFGRMGEGHVYNERKAREEVPIKFVGHDIDGYSAEDVVDASHHRVFTDENIEDFWKVVEEVAYYPEILKKRFVEDKQYQEIGAEVEWELWEQYQGRDLTIGRFNARTRAMHDIETFGKPWNVKKFEEFLDLEEKEKYLRKYLEDCFELIR